jgi:peroxiredoxin Q/BCP
VSTAPPTDATDVIREGDSVPDFTLEADDGSMVKLRAFEGKNVVLFFYPKDNTSG